MEEKKCIICGFKSHTNKHHLQKFVEYGANTTNNIVELCPNHHWIADFGNEEDKKLLLEQIKILTNKEPIIDKNKEIYYEKLLKLKGEETRCIMNEIQYNEYKQTYNYRYMKTIFLSRPGQLEYDYSKCIEKEYLLKYIIKLLNLKIEEIHKYRKENGLW